jgi:hypothetical protein
MRYSRLLLAVPMFVMAFQAVAAGPKPGAEADGQLAKGGKLSPPAADASEAVMWRDGLCRSADAFSSGLAAAEAMGCPAPWRSQPMGRAAQ